MPHNLRLLAVTLTASYAKLIVDSDVTNVNRLAGLSSLALATCVEPD